MAPPTIALLSQLTIFGTEQAAFLLEWMQSKILKHLRNFDTVRPDQQDEPSIFMSPIEYLASA